MSTFYLFEPQFLIELVALGAVVSAWIYAACTSLRSQWISRGMVLGLLGIGLVGQVFFLHYGYANFNHIFIVLLFGAGLGFMLFASGWWSLELAGLFVATNLALPATLFPVKTHLSWNYPVWALMLNALVLRGLFILGLLAVTRRPEIPRYRGGEPVRFFRRGLEMVGTTGAALGILSLFGDPGFVGALALSLLLHQVIDRWLSPRQRLPLLIAGVGALALVGDAASGLRDFPLLWLAAWLANAGYALARNRYLLQLVQRWPIAGLRAGLVLRESIYRLAPEEDGGRSRLCISSRPEEGGVLCPAGRPLSQIQVDMLRHLGESGAFAAFDDEIVVARDIPYPLFFLLSVCLTVVLSGNLLSWIVDGWR